jgi:hypothetical protein
MKPLLRWAFPLSNWVSQWSFALGRGSTRVKMWVRCAPYQTQHSQPPETLTQELLEALGLEDSMWRYGGRSGFGSRATDRLSGEHSGRFSQFLQTNVGTLRQHPIRSSAQCSCLIPRCSTDVCFRGVAGRHDVVVFLLHTPSVVGSSLGSGTDYPDLNFTIFLSFLPEPH